MGVNGFCKIWGMIFLSLLFFGVQGQEEKVHWLTLAEAEQQAQEHPKPFLIDVYTDWCGWCKQMDKTTYTDPVVISFVNRHFYPVKLNAESGDTLRFQNKIYPPVANGSKMINGLALELLGGKLSYPTTVFLYDPEKINMIVPGYIEISRMQAFMVYFAENAYHTSDINTFLDDFQQVFGTKEQKLEKAADYWVRFEELEKKRKEKPKKILLFLEASWSNSGKMMEKLVFPDSAFSALANEYFYCLHLNAQSTDTLTFMTHHFENGGSMNNNLHQLAIALSDKVLRVPGVFLFDENGKLIERLYYYLDRKRGRMILDFIGSDIFKSISWNDYVKMKSKECF